MQEFEAYLAILFKFLTASLLIERILEYLDKIFTFLGFAGGNKKMLIRLSGQALSEEEEENRIRLKMLLMQTVGVISGMVICYSSKLGIARELGFVTGDTLKWWDVFLSGMLISGGSEPIHNLINFLKEKKDLLKTERRRLESGQTRTPVEKNKLPRSTGGGESSPKFPHLKLSYDGGIYPDKPGHSLRKNNPRFIVIHHSATREDLTFEDIVKIEQKEITNEKGSYRLDPSFHCVITKDGRYHNYCRWDSVGWHLARGKTIYNANSLGLCFVGNFENRKNVKGYNTWNSNPRPTEAQIETGARMLALWRYLYDIDEKNVVGHRSVKKRHTACPGNNFPLDRLIAKSTQILNDWEKQAAVKRELDTFANQKYIYV